LTVYALVTFVGHLLHTGYLVCNFNNINYFLKHFLYFFKFFIKFLLIEYYLISFIYIYFFFNFYNFL
jgi:hypothetical protein